MMETFQSNFVFGLQGNKYQEFLDTIASPIIQKVINTEEYELIDYNHHLSFKDFENTRSSIFPTFYTNFLNDIIKNNDKVFFKTKVCISFDERLCNEICPNTGRKITTIKIAGIALAYFILFDIKEFFDFVYFETDKFESLEEIPESTIDKEPTFIVKKGYIHNINYNKKFSFIRLTVDDGIPLYHDRYEPLFNLVIGDFVDLFFESDDDKYPVQVKYSLNQNEIIGVIKRFKGQLTYPDNRSYAFINTDDKVAIYVRSSLAENYHFYDTQIVKCLASKNERGWQAEVLLVE